MSEPISIYVIWWQYDDKSGCGPLRAYSNRQRAEEDLQAFSHGGSDRVYTLVELLFWQDEPEAA